MTQEYFIVPNPPIKADLGKVRSEIIAVLKKHSLDSGVVVHLVFQDFFVVDDNGPIQGQLQRGHSFCVPKQINGVNHEQTKN